MKNFLLLNLLILGLIISSNAQKLIDGGKPKSFESKGGVKAYTIKFPGETFVSKVEEQTEENRNSYFEIGKGRSILGKIDASINSSGGSIDNFHAFYGDLDKNKSSELIVVDFNGQSNGLGVSYYTINIFPDFETKGFQTPLTFNTTEFGKDGTFVYDAKTKETLILLTEWGGLDNLSDAKRGGGLYFVGRFFHYKNSLLKPAADKPIYARRYLNSFEDERFRTDKSPLRPFLWLNSPKAQKLKFDPSFSVKPVSFETATVTKAEKIKESVKNESGETDEVEINQITVRLNSGETKIIVISKNPGYIQLESDKQKIFPETFGVMPSTISLPSELDPTLVFGNLEGKKVLLNRYQPDEDGKARYKVLFYE